MKYATTEIIIVTVVGANGRGSVSMCVSVCQNW